MTRFLANLGLLFAVTWANAATFTVINTNNGGAGSLRQAVLDANAAPGADTINFSVTGTIVLTTGQLSINDALTIVGPGASSLTIDGSANNRVFSIFENVADVCATPGADFPVSISGLTLTNGFRNVSGSSGGAVYSEKTLALSSVVISNSQASSGGGLSFNAQYSGQSLTIDNSSFLGNVARPLSTTTGNSDGGGLRVAERCSGTTSPVTITINNSLFSGNQTRPGAIFLNSAGGGGSVNAAGVDLTVTDSRIVGNSVVNQNPVVAANNRGGGISIQSARTVRIERSEISGNSANRGAGGRFINDALARQTANGVLAVTIMNSTISGNVAVTPISGAGGIGVYGNVALFLFHSTIANNASPVDAAGGVVLDTGATIPPSAGNALPPTIELLSSIVANSLNGAADIGINDKLALPTIVVNASQSLIGAVQGGVGIVGSGNLLGVDPMLGPLASNGGPTQTHALLAGSPAIDAGISSLSTDQRGVVRPQGNAPDIGAFEVSVSRQTLSVTKQGTGAGSVASTPTGINCGTTCSSEFDASAVVTLTTSASAGSTFAGWSGACTGTTTCQVTMDSAKSVVATFNTIAGANTPRLGNISTRGQVLTGNDVMIGGFIIGGSVPKTVVVRARGPSLIPFGIPNALANPTMDLFSGQNIIATNNDWQVQTIPADVAAIQTSSFAPTNALESALIRTLAPGAYTAVVSGVSNGTGVGIVEVFEVDQPAVPLINISTRGQVLTVNDVMIGGFIIQGDAPQTVVIRARGPSLIPFGIPNALLDPVLQLFDGQTPIATNDNWQVQTVPTDAAAIQASGFAPTDTREAVIRITLPPGAYTAIVTGKNNTTGVGIVEVFAQ